MRTTSAFSSARLSRVFVLSFTLAGLPFLFAQKSSPPPAPKYDLQTEVKLKGTVQEI